MAHPFGPEAWPWGEANERLGVMATSFLRRQGTPVQAGPLT